MGLLDRFTNPIWHNAQKLDRRGRRVIALTICFYDFVQKPIETDLVAPIETLLRKADYAPSAIRDGFQADLRTRLGKEALVGLLRCCKCEEDASGGIFSPKMIDLWRDVLGALVLADISHRPKGSPPLRLEDAGYSTDPDEARTQVLTKWMEILEVRNLSFVNQANLCGFAAGWGKYVEVLIHGSVLGFSRVADDQVFSRARGVAAATPVHLAGIIQGFIELVALMPQGAANSGVNQTACPTGPGARDEPVSPRDDVSEVRSKPSPGNSQQSAQSVRETKDRIEETPQAVGKLIAELIASAFSSSTFTELFGRQSFVDHWSLEDALVVWYSLGHLALVVAAWTAYNENTKVLPVLNYCRPTLVRKWGLSTGMTDKLREVVNETEAEAFKSFVASSKGTDGLVFFSRYVSRILGAPVPFSKHDTFHDIMMGIKYEGNDPVLAAAVSNLFIVTCGSVREVLGRSSSIWDSPSPNRHELRRSPINSLAQSRVNSEVQECESEGDVIQHYRIRPKPDPPMPPIRPKFNAAGKAVIEVREECGPVELIEQLAYAFMQAMLTGDRMPIATKWVERVTGKPVRNGKWETEHEVAFIRGLERFFWEGNLPSGELATIKAQYRQAHPRLAGSAIDVELTDEMRALYWRMLGGQL